MSDALRHDELAIFFRQIIGSEHQVPEAELEAVVAGIAIYFRNIDGMMPTMHLRSHEEIVQEPSFHIGTAMGKDSDHIHCRDPKENSKWIKANDTKNEKYYHITQSVIDRMGDEAVYGLQIGDSVVVGVKVPKECIAVLEAMHPIAEKAHRQEDEDNLQPKRAKLSGRGKDQLASQD